MSFGVQILCCLAVGNQRLQHIYYGKHSSVAESGHFWESHCWECILNAYSRTCFCLSCSMSLIKFIVCGSQMVKYTESSDFMGPEHLGSAEINLITNKELVCKYLDSVEFIPHIQTTVTMMSTAEIELKVKN